MGPAGFATDAGESQAELASHLDLVEMTTGYLPWWVWLVMVATTVALSSLVYAGHQKRRANAAVASAAGGSVIYPPTVTQHPPTPAQVRAIPSAPLRKARKAGVGIRNETIRNDGEFEDWSRRYGLWREEILAAAAKLSPMLHDRLETLNEMGGIPGNVAIFSPEHRRHVAIISEILRRVDRYLEEHEQ
jgi:hypothetical protein